MLTRESIIAMEPGRELDALVAEKVMGWNVFPHKPDFQIEYKDEQGFQYVFRLDEFEPSTDISAAWEVVEKMGPFTQLTSESYHNKVIWHGSFSVVDSAEADTAPLVICRAALLTTLREDG